MADTSVTFAYDALLSSTLVKYQPKLKDNISRKNALMYKLMRNEATYKLVETIGERMGVPLMYALTPADSYAGYDPLARQPMNGITTAFYEWRNLAAPIMISRDEEKKNKGEAQIFSLLEAKITQSTMGLEELFSKALIQGNGINAATAVTTPYTSPNNGSVFIDPIPLLVKKAPATGIVGAINPATAGNEFWRNQFKDIDAATTFAEQLHLLRNLFNNCSKGPGGPPDLICADQSTYEWYENALASKHQNPSYTKGDLPFESIGFKGQPMVWDEDIVNVEDESTTQDPDEGSLYMFNTKFMEIQVEKDSDFVATPFKEGQGVLARAADVLWGPGAIGISNRRKFGVAYSINTAVAA